jgi:two-component system, LuxR family, response regulator FixJ
MSNPTVFVVDDHPAVLGAMDALLTISGYTAKCFLSPEDFLSQCPLPPHGCLLIDLMVPGIDGPAFMKQLRTAGCQLPVVMTSHLVESEHAQRWLDIGVFAVLRKPFEAADFLTTIHQAMRLTSYAVACGSLKSMLATF